MDNYRTSEMVDLKLVFGFVGAWFGFMIFFVFFSEGRNLFLLSLFVVIFLLLLRCLFI